MKVKIEKGETQGNLVNFWLYFGDDDTMIAVCENLNRQAYDLPSDTRHVADRPGFVVKARYLVSLHDTDDFVDCYTSVIKFLTHRFWRFR